jgi:hypothetical protein
MLYQRVTPRRAKSSRNIVVYGLQSAKEEARKKRFDKFMAMLEGNIKPK